MNTLKLNRRTFLFMSTALASMAPFCRSYAYSNPLGARTYSEEQLFELGWGAYQGHSWGYAAMHLHAYMQLKPRVLRDSAAFAKQVIDAWYFSARQMEDITEQARMLPNCQAQLERARGGAASRVSGLTKTPPAVDWERIKGAGGYNR